MSQDDCPYNVKLAQALKVPELAPRAVLASNDATTIAHDILRMSPAEFSAAFKGSPMKRAKLRGLKRNAALVLGNGDSRGDADGMEALRRALHDDEPLVREHAAWALARLGR